MEIVTAKALTKDYDVLRAVDNIDFAIAKGECFGFLGPNGAGKTTVMRMLYCFLTPSAGTINIFGMNAAKHKSAIKARIGVMPQDDNLDVDLTVLQNLLVYARYFDIPRNRSMQIALELLDNMGLTEKSKVSIRNLSGGMKRSLLLARALINNPEILFLDEPTTGLDPHSRRIVWEKLDDLRSKGTTLILTTHYMEEAEHLCDRVAIMDTGKIVTIDSPGALTRLHGGNMEAVYLKLTGRRLEE